MTSCLAAVVLVLPLLLSGCTGVQGEDCPEGLTDVADVGTNLPVGSALTYTSYHFGNDAGQRSTARVVGREMMCGIQAFRIEYSDGKVAWARSGDQAPFLEMKAGAVMSSWPVCTGPPLPAPLGTTTTTQCHHRNRSNGQVVEITETRRFHVVDVENLTTQAGSFRAWKVTLDDQVDLRGAPDLSTTMWWVPGCPGMVKSYPTPDGRTMELVAYSCGPST